MNNAEVSRRIQELCASFDGKDKPLSVEQIRELLTTLASHPSDLESFERFDATAYHRNRIFRATHFDILLLCWKPGQRTPIHDHSGSTCGVHVLKGSALEINFLPDTTGVLFPSESKLLREGSITVSVDSDAHMVANSVPSSPGIVSEDLVTIHCYSPPLDSMRVFGAEETFFGGYSTLVASTSKDAHYRLEL